MGEVFTYESLLSSGDIEYTTDKHKNFNNVLKYLGDGQLKYEDWKPIGMTDGEDELYVCSKDHSCELYTRTPFYDSNRQHFHCVCSEPLLRQYYAINAKTNNVILLGSRCIQKLGPIAYQRHLRLKGEAEGKRYCEHCGICIRKDIVERAIERGDRYFYHVGCKELDKKKKKEPPPPPYTPPRSTVSTETIVKFGKYKGQPLSNLLQDQGYMKWIVIQDETSGQFLDIQQFIKNSNLIV
jgi:hypothetical protein